MAERRTPTDAIDARLAMRIVSAPLLRRRTQVGEFGRRRPDVVVAIERRLVGRLLA